MKKAMLFTTMLVLLLNTAWAQQHANQRIPLIGHDAPSFRAETTNGQINFPKDFGKNWKIVFAHPRDFTPVCSSEILELAYKQEQFNKLGAKLVVVSVDPLEQHKNWKAALEEVKYKGRDKVKISFPLAADPNYAISNSYGMVDDLASVGQSIRGVFYIDPENKIRSFAFYPNEVGRSVDEILRTLVALQTNYKHNRYVTPANWKPGDDVMVTVLSDEDKLKLLRPNSGVYSLNWFMNFKNLP